MNDMSSPIPESPDEPPQTRRALADFTPVPRKSARHDGWTPERQRGFIEALADLGSVKAAAHAVGMSPEGAYLLRRHPEAKSFRKAWKAALSRGVERLEDVAMERALLGVEVPVYSYGKLVGSRRVYNDKLLMFLLRNRAPRRFASDSIQNADAATRSQLKRLKADWLAEWEAEQEANNVSPQEVTASIVRKVEAARRRIEARSSPQAYEHEMTALAQRRADEAAGWLPGEPYAPFAAQAAELMAEKLVEVRSEWPEKQAAVMKFLEQKDEG
ncbi:MAG: hypothetical protein P8J20_12360 [Novosphingobium sp.]|nr:hypothetical protein [Novosphingobium sp.]